MDGFKAPFFSKDELYQRAEAFLKEHHPERTFPVPIDSIIERMGIDIVPAPNIQVDAYTTSDLKEIWIEEFVYLKRWARYRFSLAHEVGHITLHADLFRSVTFKTVSEWKAFLESIPDKEYRYLEFHADQFAGQVLMPRKELHAAVEDCKTRILEAVPEAPNDPDAFRDFVAQCVADKFDVSHHAALVRMAREKIFFV